MENGNSGVGGEPLTIDNIPEPIFGFLKEQRGWDTDMSRQKIIKTQQILRLRTVADAITFLLLQYIEGRTLTICDGCNVRPPFEHRCHGSRAVVRGEQTGEPCRCVECFLVEHSLY